MAKNIPCHMCMKYQGQGGDWYCPSGKHPETPGRIHSGRGATVDCDWECPNCHGLGHIKLSWLDVVLLYFARRMADLRHDVDGARI